MDLTLANSQPKTIARTLALALSRAFQNDDKAELIRLASVVKDRARLLAVEFEPLVFYARAIENWASGDITGAIYEFRCLRESGHTFRPGCYSVTLSKRYGCLKIADLLLDMPESVFGKVIICKSGGHFSTLRTRFTDAEILKTSLQELGFAVKTNADVRGFMGQRVRADVVAVLKGDCDLGWSRNSEGFFDLICDLGCVSDLYEQTSPINFIIRQYDLNKTLTDSRSQI